MCHMVSESSEVLKIHASPSILLLKLMCCVLFWKCEVLKDNFEDFGALGDSALLVATPMKLGLENFEHWSQCFAIVAIAW